MPDASEPRDVVNHELNEYGVKLDELLADTEYIVAGVAGARALLDKAVEGTDPNEGWGEVEHAICMLRGIAADLFELRANLDTYITNSPNE